MVAYRLRFYPSTTVYYMERSNKVRFLNVDNQIQQSRDIKRLTAYSNQLKSCLEKFIKLSEKDPAYKDLIDTATSILKK